MKKYILSLCNSRKKLRIKVNNKNYLIYADTTNEVFISSNNDFKLKETLNNMQNKENYPSYSHYLLLDKHTKNPFKLTMYGKTYMFIVNSQYFSKPNKDFFSLKEKLYILNLSCDIIWKPISLPKMFYNIIFNAAISPSLLNLNIVKGKALPYILKKGAF